ncbi:type II toxin-antitoxin system RelE/ParE family toxin [Asticcacaulis sp. EMRT-3]|uniref:type II toxin-antitoxin system RelE family toxin n=1 Tax=Asticcacaulis sp. EMRT-3 TaxID=3040349 RepID=UPI0024AEE08F|nr:type II toxin-antitoxin system RelE/ParE family toxin [Asticcacaulis sp. EMRT-3]MDI7775150.1 type II toxin-antitoxin system RelE/ParE family toxin [Asticcacaulis sp. EMRT-3]
MTKWSVRLSDTARKQLKKLDRQTANRIIAFLGDRIAIADDPRSLGKALTGPNLGKFWRYRVGDYRLICDIQDGELCVLVVEVGNRREVYR